MGIGFYGLAPLGNLGSNFGTGFQAGLQIHFNRESRHLGRLRIEYLKIDSKDAIQTGLFSYWNGSTFVTQPQFSNSRMEGYSVAYEWLPHLENHSRSGLFGIFGMGGTFWNESLQSANQFYTGTRTEIELGFTLSAGAGWRINPHTAVEARFVHSTLESGGLHNYGAIRSYLAFGASFRF